MTTIKDIIEKKLGGYLTPTELEVVLKMRECRTNAYGGDHDRIEVLFLPGKMDARIQVTPASYVVERSESRYNLSI